MIEHTSECIARDKKLQAERDAWLKQWPNHCKKCKGTGELHWQENQSPIGSGMNWLMDMGDVCSCLENLICPRCGFKNPLWEDHDWDARPGVTCKFCGWNEAAPDMCPPGPDYPCGCESTELQARHDEWWSEWDAERETIADVEADILEQEEAARELSDEEDFEDYKDL